MSGNIHRLIIDSLQGGQANNALSTTTDFHILKVQNKSFYAHFILYETSLSMRKMEIEGWIWVSDPIAL